MTNSTSDLLLTPREVADILGVSATTVRRWARTGALEPSVRTPGGHRRYRRADILAFQDATTLLTP
jgi:excisionase family DNA binding protein